MKKFLVLAGFVLLVAGAGVAGEADLFSYDQVAVETQMADLNTLEQFVLANPGLHLSDLIASDNEMVANLAKSSSFYGLESMSEKVLGIGGFWWGCCLGPIGVLVVWLGADDSGETRSALIGCIISSLLSAGSSGYYYWGYNI